MKVYIHRDEQPQSNADSDSLADRCKRKAKALLAYSTADTMARGDHLLHDGINRGLRIISSTTAHSFSGALQ
jgi:hypothetical protein